MPVYFLESACLCSALCCCGLERTSWLRAEMHGQDRKGTGGMSLRRTGQNWRKQDKVRHELCLSAFTRSSCTHARAHGQSRLQNTFMNLPQLQCMTVGGNRRRALCIRAQRLSSHLVRTGGAQAQATRRIVLQASATQFQASVQGLKQTPALLQTFATKIQQEMHAAKCEPRMRIFVVYLQCSTECARHL